jgi:DinB family protein
MSPIAKETNKTEAPGSPTAAANQKLIISGSRRADKLADRIEEGAANLASFVESVSAREWRTPVSPTDHRSVGVIVHHVASVYPIEIDLARKIASGQAVTDVTWDSVAALNSKHAADHAEITKEAALELLRRNSRDAADAVRESTDDELDTIAPFSLSFGAPVTAQFVVEDHALRHSWHHLARIRAALRR